MKKKKHLTNCLITNRDKLFK